VAAGSNQLRHSSRIGGASGWLVFIFDHENHEFSGFGSARIGRLAMDIRGAFVERLARSESHGRLGWPGRVNRSCGPAGPRCHDAQGRVGEGRRGISLEDRAGAGSDGATERSAREPPVGGKSEVLVRVHAVSLNRGDRAASEGIPSGGDLVLTTIWLARER
jgi:hypothetical protein